MKRLLTILAFLLLAAPAMAGEPVIATEHSVVGASAVVFPGTSTITLEDPWTQLARMNPAVLGSGGSGEAYTCATGTYMFWWNGDYNGDADKACYNSGAGSKDGTVSEATVSSSYIQIDSTDQYISWVNDTSDIFNPSQGTLFFSIYVVDSDSNSDVDNNQIFEIYVNTNNCLYIITSDATNKVAAYWRGSSQAAVSVATGSTLSVGQWYRVGYSWQPTAEAEGNHSIVIASGETAVANWDAAVEEADGLDTWTSSPSKIHVGENALGLFAYETDGIRVKDIIITSGYKDADQL